jgi:hypothetical protein
LLPPPLDQLLAAERLPFEQATHDLEQLLVELAVNDQPPDLPLERAD